VIRGDIDWLAVDDVSCRSGILFVRSAGREIGYESRVVELGDGWW
jgi:hypothetical protein